MTRKSADRILSRRVLVVVDRDMTAKTSRIVWQHEIPILEAIFGEGKVVLSDPKALDEGYEVKTRPELLPWNKQQDTIRKPSETAGLDWVFVGDPRAEYDRLAAAYGTMPESKITNAENVYGRYQDGRFERVVGSAEVEDLPEAQLRDLIKSYGFIPIMDQFATDEDKRKARDKTVLLNTAPHPELVKIAAELGVELS